MSTSSRPTASGRDERTSQIVKGDFVGRLGLGIATGLLLGFVAAILPVVAIVVTLVLGVATILAVRARDTNRGLAFAGVLTGVGLVLLAAALNTAIRCSAADNLCGDANVVPLVAYAGTLVGVGVAATVLVARQRRLRG
jgi:thiol:disulfide interchange protein